MSLHLGGWYVQGVFVRADPHSRTGRNRTVARLQEVTVSAECT